MRAVFLAPIVLMAALPEAAEARADEAPPCDVIEAEYALAANLELTDTPMGQGNGTYRIGPGFALVRWSQKDRGAQLVAYGMTERFVVESRTLFWKTKVTTDSKTTVAADACGVVVSGRLDGKTLAWSGDVHGMRTDGWLTCEGSLCGSFGAPPPGRSELHVAPHDVHFLPWTFSPDAKTFAMPRTWISHSESPQQTGFITLAGRETRRTCVRPTAACAPHE